MNTNKESVLKEKTKNVVVVGAGGAGIAAAHTLASGGARVVILEKMSFAGGSTNYVEGTYAVESEMQYRKNIKMTRDEGFRELMGYSHWRANPDLVRAIVDKSADTISWLEREGVEFVEPTAYFLGGPRVWHLFKGFGNMMINVLVANAEKKGVEIRYENTVKKLLRDGDGPVTGVIVQDKDGNQTKVEAAAVIIATGGYAGNTEWIKKYTGLDLGINLFSVVRSHKTGEGIEMAWEAGAGEEGIEVLLFNFGMPPRTIIPKGHMLGAVGQPTLWVNQHGVRFCDETVIENMIHTGNVMSRQPGGYVFRIFDEEIKSGLVERGGLNLGNYSPPRMPLTNLDEEIKDAVEKKSPYVFVADSIEELADKMGVDKNKLTETVDQYNGFCAKGHDDQYAKDPSHLQPIRTPRFYSFKCYTDFLATLGGIKINEKTEVLDRKGSVISGLYAVGCDAGGMYGDSYDILAAGIGSGFALNSGRIAGESVLKYIGP
jgi:fumarate reductase flavoprotein subunit